MGARGCLGAAGGTLLLVGIFWIAVEGCSETVKEGAENVKNNKDTDWSYEGLKNTAKSTLNGIRGVIDGAAETFEEWQKEQEKLEVDTTSLDSLELKDRREREKVDLPPGRFPN